MAYFPDLGTESQISRASFVRAVGWLAADHSYSVGETSPEFVEKLRLMAEQWFASTSTLAWPVTFGVHICEFCGNVRAGGNFGVPSGSILYVAPEMICHYVEAHGYKPPDAFINAVLECPLPDTPEYGRSVHPFIEAEDG